MGGKKKVATKGLAKKKGSKKKAVDNFLKKEWYEVKAPALFDKRDIGKTLVNKSSGNKLAADSLRGRVFEVSQADLSKNAEEDAFRTLRFRVDDVQGRVCLTNFYGMRLTTDRLRSLVRKWHSLIDAHVDVKTSEGYTLRVFAIALTKKVPGQHSKTAYAQSSQIKMIRKRMREVIEKEINGNDLTSLMKRLMSESIGREIERLCNSIFPLQNACIRKVKTLRTPKTDLAKLLEIHGGAAGIATSADAGEVVDRSEDVEVEDAEEEE